MEDLDHLQHLSLVSKVCTELDNHLGLNDKDLAEFIIDLASKHSTYEKFRKALIKNGAEFDDSFIANLLRLIQHMVPPKISKVKKKKQKAASPLSLRSAAKEELKEKLPFLAMPDDPTVRIMKELEDLMPKLEGDVKDFDAMLESVPMKSEVDRRPEPRDIKMTDRKADRRSRSRSRSDRHGRTVTDRERSRDRRRGRSRSRSVSDSRHRKRYHRSGSRSKGRKERRHRSRSNSKLVPKT